MPANQQSFGPLQAAAVMVRKGSGLSGAVE